MLLSERSQDLTAARGGGSAPSNGPMPHQGATVCSCCTEVVRSRALAGLAAPSPPQSLVQSRVGIAHRSETSSSVAAALIAWHARQGRHDLPWQSDRTPYRVWVS